MYATSMKQAVQTRTVHRAYYIKATEIFSSNVITKKIANNRYSLYHSNVFSNLWYSGRVNELCCSESTVSIPEKLLYAVIFLYIKQEVLLNGLP